MKRSLFFALALFLPIQAHALTAGDVLDKMTTKESNAYVQGAVTMLAYYIHKEVSEEKGRCILNWFYEEGGPSEVVEFYDAYKDLDAVGIIRILADRHCK